MTKTRLKKYNPLQPAFHKIKRTWRSHGFGVHSPFAFRFITCVLREQAPFYSYQAIRKLAKTEKEFRFLTCLFRIACEVRPTDAIIADRDGDIQRRILSMSDSTMKVHLLEKGLNPDSINATLLYIGFFSDESIGNILTAVRKVISRQGAIICLDIPESFNSKLKDMLINGMSFTNGRMTIFISRSDLPRQDFEIDF